MPANAEQIKQKIAIELENARLAGSFYLPVIAVIVSLVFTEEFFPEKFGLRVIFIVASSLTLIVLFLYRAECFRNVRKLIGQL